jgi:hypothetical protein
MRRAPWKLIAGGLVLSAGGLAAVAGVPGRTGQVACAPQQPESAAPAIPALPPAGQTLPPQAPATTSPSPVPAVVVSPADLPPIPAAPMIVQVQATETAPMPRTAAEAVFELPVPTVASPTPMTAAVPTPLPATLDYAIPLVPNPATVATPKPATGEAAPDVVPAQFTSPASTEKKLRVSLHLSDERPRFVVRDGDEVYLRVVCDKVDVKSPSERGEAMSTMHAAGKVAFVTPGGEGLCDELTVVPGTGQVIVSGKVSFKYNWGKVETTVSGDRMTFRLGSAPGVTPAGSTTVPASYQKPVK